MRTAPACLSLLLLSALTATSPARATWSVVAVDTMTQEVVVGSATCVTGIDLKAFLPVVVVGQGGGAAQSFVDQTGVRRLIIHDGIEAGLSAQQIVDQLEMLADADNHQHGVAEGNGGSSDTHTGANNGAHASGVAGSFGDVHYAIQGNVLTGSPVVTMAQSAFVNTAGDLPEKLMVAMEAARAMGGDGRCSCSPGDPTGCGAPPPMFDKSAHVGFMIVSRFGDVQGATCNANGCATGDYFLDFNVPSQGVGDPDPVLQLRDQFDAWRAGLEGRPDALETTVEFVRTGNDFLLRIVLVDWRGVPLGVGVDAVTVEHAVGSAQVTTIGAVNDLGNGTYETLLTRGPTFGIDRFLVTIDDGVRDVVLPPNGVTLDLRIEIFVDGFESGNTSLWN